MFKSFKNVIKCKIKLKLLYLYNINEDIPRNSKLQKGLLLSK